MNVGTNSPLTYISFHTCDLISFIQNPLSLTEKKQGKIDPKMKLSVWRLSICLYRL